MEPTSPVQYTAAVGGQLPPADPVRDGVWSLAFAVPHGHVPYSLGYVVDDFAGGLHIIDAGWPNEQNWAALTAFLRSIGRTVADVATMTSTHLHPDHLGMAGRIREMSGATVVLHRTEDAAAKTMRGASSLADASGNLEPWGVPADARPALLEDDDPPPLPPHLGADLLIEDGDVLPIPGRTFRAVLTPGHTSGHVCLHEAETGLLLSGDHVMPTLRAGLGLGGTSANPVAEYLHALRRIAALDDCEVAPGHEYRFRGLAARCGTTAAHHLRRTRQVLVALEANDTGSVWEIAAQLTWKKGWENLRGHYGLSALAQAEMHMTFIRSGEAAEFLRGSPVS